MQEEVENRTVNLAISTSKLTGRTLVSAFRKYLQHRSSVKMKKPLGEQTIDQLVGQNQGATNIEIERTDIQGFKKILDKYGVDYAVTKDLSKEPPRFLVFFKARDVDVLKSAFKEYSASMLQKEKKPSVLERLTHFKELAASVPKKVREKKQEHGL